MSRGRDRLSGKIINLIPDHLSYVEAFAGAAWVFFRKQPSKYEVLNDLDKNLVSFYRIVKHHFEAFVKEFKFLLVSRSIFEDYKQELECDGLTDIQRAARYYYVQRLCYSGRLIVRFSHQTFFDSELSQFFGCFIAAL